jgi:cytochrome c oxidase assembly protein subunit 15
VDTLAQPKKPAYLPGMTLPMTNLLHRRQVAIWLACVAGLVALMVVVGGLTRLTDSGLSITAWKPIHGALPPMSTAEWEEELAAYRQIPEYQKINKGMTLEEFKSIFWWEWGHRNLGRLIGLAFFIPFVVFLALGRIERAWIPRLVLLFCLGGLQGFVGWWMVASGLTERTDVSQYRLVAHLSLALVIYCGLIWTALEIAGWQAGATKSTAVERLFPWSLAFLALVFFQIMLGGFVAGTDAGMTYNTWPLMDGRFVPDGYWGHEPWWLSPFEHIQAIQFNHRIGGYAVFAAAIALWWRARKSGDAHIARLGDILLAVTVAQVFIGIATLIAVMPIWLAAMHQLGAVILLTAATAFAFALKRTHWVQRGIQPSPGALV